MRQAATDIISILTAPPSTTVPSLQAGDPTRNALLEIATVLNRTEKLPVTSSPTPYVLPQRVKTIKKTNKNISTPVPTANIPHPKNGVKKILQTERPQRVNPQDKGLSWKRGEDQPVNHGYRLRSRNHQLKITKVKLLNIY